MKFFIFLKINDFLDSSLNQFYSLTNFPSVFSQPSTNLPSNSATFYSQSQFTMNSAQVPAANQSFVSFIISFYVTYVDGKLFMLLFIRMAINNWAPFINCIF